MKYWRPSDFVIPRPIRAAIMGEAWSVFRPGDTAINVHLPRLSVTCVYFSPIVETRITLERR